MTIGLFSRASISCCFAFYLMLVFNVCHTCSVGWKRARDYKKEMDTLAQKSAVTHIAGASMHTLSRETARAFLSNNGHFLFNCNDVTLSVHKRGGWTKLLDNINCTFTSSELIALVGTSGSGKSSMLKVLMFPQY